MRLEPKEEGMRWLMQAGRDLDHARYSFEGKRFNLACFLSQQAAEKAVKAFIYAQGRGDGPGAFCGQALETRSELRSGYDGNPGIWGLDKYYIPTRYPNGLPGGMPYEAFDEDDARKAMGMAAKVVEYMSRAMEGT